MVNFREGNKFLEALMKKIGFKEVLYRLHLGKSYGYMWFKSDDIDKRRSPVEMIDEIITMGIAAGYLKEVHDLLNHFNAQFYGGHYAPGETLFKDMIQQFEAIKNHEVLKNGK